MKFWCLIFPAFVFDSQFPVLAGHCNQKANPVAPKQGIFIYLLAQNRKFSNKWSNGALQFPHRKWARVLCFPFEGQVNLRGKIGSTMFLLPFIAHLLVDVSFPTTCIWINSAEFDFLHCKIQLLSFI